MLHGPEWYENESIRFVSGDPVVAINRARREVRSNSGLVVGYDRLLIATGSLPNRLSIPGADLDGVFTFRDLRDVAAIEARAAVSQSAVVIGGGLLGLEAAYGLARRGLKVTVVHSSAYIMERQLDPHGSTTVRELLRERNIECQLNARTVALEGEASVRAVRLEDGTVLAAELVILAVGITPNVALASTAGLQVRRGIVVDDTLQSFDPRIYAVGECAEHRGNVYGIVAPLYEQAKVCAAHLAGAGHIHYAGSSVATSLKVSGIEVFSAGEITAKMRDGDHELILRDPEFGIYKRLILRNGCLVGAILIGERSDGAWYEELITTRQNILAIQDRLLFGRAYVEFPKAA